MPPEIRELLDLAVRWLHVVAAILWIGNSMLYNWLDRNLLPSASGREGVQGEIWLLHSGGFYRVEKDLGGWDRARPLHWFKWQAYTTWLSGAALLVLVYYMGGGALLLRPGLSGVGTLGAAAIGLGLLLGAWLVYDLLVAPLLARAGSAGATLALALVMALAWGLAHVLTGRAAFLHVGAVLGTLMAGNVFRVIMPAQRELVSAVEAGRVPDPAPAARAKDRSIHNNYMTSPVVALMLSSHFPGLYGHRSSWILLGVIVLAGALVRHLMNIRFTWRGWAPALAATVAVALIGLWAIGRSGPGSVPSEEAAAGGEPVPFSAAHAVIQQRCTVCHSDSPAIATFGPAPAGAAFDSPDQIAALVERIRVRAVDTRTMPPANLTHMTDAERALLRRWIEAGAPVR